MDSNGPEKCLDGFGIYPSLRDHPMKTAAQWIQGRRLDDDIGDLWRVHDKLYDLSGFIDSHPGGGMWLQVTRGTDITEAFESSHLDGQKVDAILSKFYRRQADQRRQSPFTFHPDGFYRTLKQRANHHLKHNVTLKDKQNGQQKVKTVQNRMLFTLAILVALSIGFTSYSLSILSGLLLALNMILSHNFSHRKFNYSYLHIM